MSTRASATAPRGTYHHGDLKAALVAEAIKLVRIEGPNHLSLREVAANCKVSPSAAYHYFPDKDSLVSAIGDYCFQELARIQEEAISKVVGNSAKAAKARLRESGRSYFQWAKKDPNLFRLMFGGFCSINKTDEADQDPAYLMLVRVLDDLLTHGVITKAARQNAELAAWPAVHGATTLIIEGHIPEEAYEAVLDTVEAALGIK